jgi:hypothetical protein
MRRSLMNSDGVIVNIVIADEDWPAPEGLSFGPDGGEIGHRWLGDAYDVPGPLAASFEPESAPMERASLALFDSALADQVQAQQATIQDQQRQIESQAQAIERVQTFIDRLTAESQNITEQPLL